MPPDPRLHRTGRFPDSGELWNRTAILGHDRDRTAFWIFPVGGRVDAKVPENRGREVRRADSPVLDVVTLRVSTPDHLARGQSTAGNQHRHAIRPVVAAGILVNN